MSKTTEEIINQFVTAFEGNKIKTKKQGDELTITIKNESIKIKVPSSSLRSSTGSRSV